GGILGGDRLEVEVDVSPGASATVLTQAANKAYRGEEASQAGVLRVGDGGLLEYLPHHLIPYAGSDYRQETVFQLVPDATLLAWDAFAAGRVARGERFAFSRLRGRTTIFRDGIPEAIDGFDLAGASEPFGGYSYVAGAHVLAPDDLGPLAEELHLSLACVPGTLASASAPAPGLCVVRILADRAPELYRALNGVRCLVRKSLGLPAPAREVD
ncbi:MAG TPA: urease accessory protein UreD, partial [Rubrobacter sp.]|nr:urease accessory protein UreD [Rubrobacter sp.]